MRALALASLLCLSAACERVTPAEPGRPAAPPPRPAAPPPRPAASPPRPASLLPSPDTPAESVRLYDLVTARRPERGPARDRCGPLTTRALADAEMIAANPEQVATACCRLESRCRGAACAEQLATRDGRVLVDAGRALAELAAEFGAADATEVLIVESESPRHLSVWRGDSAFTDGAAHSNNHLDCATYDPVTGRRLTPRDFLGARAAAAEQAARARLEGAEHPAAWRFDPDAFVVRGGQLRFCASGEETIVDGEALLL